MLNFIAATMYPAMLAWLIFGVIVLVQEWRATVRDKAMLQSLKEIVFSLEMPDYAAKLSVRTRVMEWVKEHSGSNLARWTHMLNNAVMIGGEANPVPFLETIWMEERERVARIKQIARMAILIGLFYTSAGLCKTLAQIGPMLIQTGVTPDEWMKAVQPALAGVLGGMSEAFYSSLLGLLIAASLQIAAQFSLERLHAAFLRDLDTFIQGGLMPIYSSIVEHDRSDIVREVMERADEAFAAVRDQYEKLLAQEAARLLHMEKLQADVTAAAEGLSHVMKSFRQGADKLQNFGESFQRSTSDIFQTSDLLKEVARRQDQSLDAFAELKSVLVPKSDEIESELERRKLLVTDLLAETSKALGDRLTRYSEQLVLQISENLEAALSQTLDHSLKRQEDLVGEINRATAEKWDKLLAASAASQGMGRFR